MGQVMIRGDGSAGGSTYADGEAVGVKTLPPRTGDQIDAAVISWLLDRINELRTLPIVGLGALTVQDAIDGLRSKL